MLLKNSLGPDNTSDKQYQEYAEQINIYKKLVSKTKKMHIKKFHKEIRNLKTRNPKEFCKIIQSECKQSCRNTSSRVFNEFIEHFRELNSDPMFSGAVHQFVDTSTFSEYNVINQPFTVPEITAAIKLLKNNKAGGVDNVINEFFKYCNKIAWN